MLAVILIEQEKNMFHRFADFLRQRNLQVFREDSEDGATGLLESRDIDAVVVADQDFSLVKKLVTAFPMINYAVVSARKEDDFHKTAEGYGIFMRLPVSLQECDAEAMVRNLMRLKKLSTGAGEGENDN